MKKFIFISILFFLLANVLLAQKDTMGYYVNIKYKSAICSADSCYKAKNFEAAKRHYQEAMKILPGEMYPDRQVTLCEKKIKEITSNEIVDRDPMLMSFMRTIKSADSLLNLKEYEKAKIKYQEGHSINPKEQYPKDKIEIIDGLIKNEKYKTAIARADSAYEFYFHVGLDDSKYSKQYQTAKNLYQKASAIDAKENYPLERIKEIDRIFQEIKNTAEGLEQKKTSHSYYEKANSYFETNDFINARKYYLLADSIYHDHYTNKEQIMLCEDLASINNKDSLERFHKLVRRGDSSMFHFQGKWDLMGYDQNDLKYSIIVFNQALRIKKDSKYVLMRMDRIAKNIEGDGPDMPYKKYNEAIVKADALFKAAKYFEALNAYKAALDLKPSEQYPKDMAVLSSKKGQEQFYRDSFQPYTAVTNISNIKIDMSTGMLTWNVAEDKKDRTYKIGEKRWNKYMKLGEVASKGKNNSEYSFHVPIDSGFYYLCVEYKDDSIVKGRGMDVPLIGEDVHSSTADSRDYTYFTKATRYEMYSKEGKKVKQGYSDRIYTGDLEPDVYYLNYGNMTVEFIKGKKK